MQPFLRYLLQRKHSEVCVAKSSDEWCLLCALEVLAAETQKATEPINPKARPLLPPCRSAPIASVRPHTLTAPGVHYVSLAASVHTNHPCRR